MNEELKPIAVSQPEAEIAKVEGNDGLDHLQVIARYPYQMEKCQAGLVKWCEQKIQSLQAECDDLSANMDIGVSQGWKIEALDRAFARTQKRIQFYDKMKAALENGYCIVPNFPVEMFAIRTKAKEPDRKSSNQWTDTHEQDAQKLPAGEGQYKNPFPVVHQMDYGSEGKPDKRYWAEDWREMEFPFVTAKPLIMDATARALADKVFDEIGVLPGKNKRQDPIVVGRIIDPRSTKFNKVVVTFLVAWFIDTRTL